MLEIDRIISLNGLHILIMLFVYNLIMNKGSLCEFVGGFISRIETQTLWFLLIDIFILYSILTNLKFELGFRAAIKFKI